MVIEESGYVPCQACDTKFHIKYRFFEWPPYCAAHRWPDYPKISADEVVDAYDFLKNVRSVNFITLYGKPISG